MITQKLDLNLIHGQVRSRVNVSQFDSGTRTLEIAVYNNTARFTLLGTYTVSIEGRKPDNTAFQYDGIIDTVNNVATFDVTEQMTAVYGDVVVEMVINDGDDRIGTGNFILAVEAAPLNDDSVISESVLPLVQRAADIAETIEDTVLPIRVEKDFAPVITTDDAMNKNAIDIKAKIDPVQDLHGYAFPWVGGAGKNLVPLTVDNIKARNGGAGTWTGNEKTISGVKWTINTDNDGNVVGISTSGTSTAQIDFGIMDNYAGIGAGSYTLSGCPSGGTGDTYYVLTQKDGAWGAFVDYGSGNTGTASTGITGYVCRVRSGVNMNGKTFKPMICVSTAQNPTTFEPYTNICPITGHSEVKLLRGSQNWFNKMLCVSNTYVEVIQLSTGVRVVTKDNGQYRNAGFTLIDDLTPYIGKTLIFSCKRSGTGNGPIGIQMRNSSNIETFWRSSSASDVVLYAPVTADHAGDIFRIVPYANNDTNTGVGFYMEYTDIQVEIDVEERTPSNYKPFEPINIYTLDLDGTRYKGTLDVDAGVLTLTHEIESTTWSAGTDSTQFTNCTRKKFGILSNAKSGATAVSNVCEYYANWSQDTAHFYIDSNSLTLVVFLPNGTASDTAIQVLYELATPQTIALDPTDVLMLWAYNTLFGDTGDISLIYDATGILRIAMEKLDIDTFKAVVAASSDFADFKTRVAAL